MKQRWEIAASIEDTSNLNTMRQQAIFDAIRALMTPPEIKKRSIGFKLSKDKD